MRVKIPWKRIQKNNTNNKKLIGKYLRVIIILVTFNNNIKNFDVKLYLEILLLLIVCNENSLEFNLKGIFKYVLIPITYKKNGKRSRT